MVVVKVKVWVGVAKVEQRTMKKELKELKQKVVQGLKMAREKGTVAAEGLHQVKARGGWMQLQEAILTLQMGWC